MSARYRCQLVTCIASMVCVHIRTIPVVCISFVGRVMVKAAFVYCVCVSVWNITFNVRNTFPIENKNKTNEESKVLRHSILCAFAGSTKMANNNNIIGNHEGVDRCLRRFYRMCVISNYIPRARHSFSTNVRHKPRGDKKKFYRAQMRTRGHFFYFFACGISGQTLLLYR